MTDDLFDDQATLVGGLQSIRFESEQGDFSVATVEVPRRRGSHTVTVIGNLRGAIPGERLQMRGRWEHNERYGRQFRAQDTVVLPPTTREGIVRYLSSDLIEGVGKVTAERLVEAFGERTLDVIEGQRHRLLEVPGIGPVRHKRILEAWDKQRAVRQVMLFLSSHGVSATFAHRIYEKYGDQAVQVVKRHPYRLARDVFGIGFKSADRIAMTLGIKSNDAERIAAGLGWVLDEARGQGHIFLPENVLVEQASAVLEVDEGEVRATLDATVREGTLMIEAGLLPNGDRAVYLRSLHSGERELAQQIATHLEQVSAGRRKRWIEMARAAEQRIGIELDPGQRQAVTDLIGQPLGVLTGGPGTGKTTLVRLFAEAAKRAGARVLLAAPTGRAARRISESSGLKAQTIHRLLEFSFKERRFLRDAEQPLDADLVVVDEASMLDQYLARALMRGIGERTSLLLVGDADQLPSVGAGNVLHDLLEVRAIPAFQLTEVFRQAAQSHIVRNAHRIRQGQVPIVPSQRRGGPLQDFYQLKVDGPEMAVERILRLVCERIPEAFGLDPLRDVQVLAPMHKGECGIEALNRVLQDALNRDGQPVTFGDREFRRGDKVIQLRNNYQRQVFNGEIGQLVRLNLDEDEYVVSFDGRQVPYKRRELGELTLAYCISIHKSQGSEYPAVVVPLTTQHWIMMQRNLLYTAVTRAKKLVCLVGQQRALAQALRNDAPQHRHTALAQRLRDSESAGSAEVLILR